MSAVGRCLQQKPDLSHVRVRRADFTGVDFGDAYLVPQLPACLVEVIRQDLNSPLLKGMGHVDPYFVCERASIRVGFDREGARVGGQVAREIRWVPPEANPCHVKKGILPPEAGFGVGGGHARGHVED